MALASSTSDWRSSVQDASPQRRGAGGLKVVFLHKSKGAWAHEVDINVAWRLLKQTILKRAWKLYVKDERDVDMLIKTKAECSYALAIMDKIGGWIESGRNEAGSQVGVRRAASMCTYTKAFICNGHKVH